MVTIHQRFPYLVVVYQDLPVVKIRLYSRLGSLVWGSCWSWRVVELPWCFLLAHFVAREDIAISGCIGGRSWLEFGESCVSWIGDRSDGVGLEVFAGCFCGAGSSEIGKV